MKTNVCTYKNLYSTFLGLILVLVGCGKTTSNSSGAKISSSVKNANTTASSSVSREAIAKDMQLFNLEGLFNYSATNIGQNTTAGLTSLKYYITTINICQSMTTSGSGFSNAKNCIEIYQGNSADPNFTYDSTSDYTFLAAAARKYTSGFIDLMDSSARSGLNKSISITKENIGSYKYGYVNWYPVMKVTASVPVGNSTFYTSDGVVTNNSGYVTTSTDTFSSLTEAKEAVVVSGNGGNWFAFQNPLEIKQADIDAQSEIAVDLTFNPDGLLKAVAQSATPGCGPCQFRDAAGNSFVVPMLALAPVARKSTDATMKEVYQGSVSSGTDNFDVRIELYYVKSDAAKTIYGVDVRTLVNNSSSSFVNDVSKISYVKTNADGSINLQNYGEANIIKNLIRKSTVGESTTATIDCATSLNTGGFTFSGCGATNSDPTTKDISLELKSVVQLQ